jgi:excisionase family DNA binding protein
MPKTSKSPATIEIALASQQTTARDLLRIEEVALACNCSCDTIRRLIKRQRLPATRIGNGIRVPAAELKRYLESQATA